MQCQYYFIQWRCFDYGLTSDANSKLFTSNTQVVWGCNPWQGSPCSNNEIVTGLNVGSTYFLSVQSATCEEWIPIVIQGGGGCDDADGDGTCDTDDCQPNNPALPTTPGSACNDFNSNTTNDQIQSDGCTCQGTPVGGGCSVSISSSNGGVTITGLTSDANSKLFNSNTQAVWGCNPWSGTPCSNNESVSGLTVGATYFLSVQSNSCEEWIPIVIQGGGGGTGVDLTIANFSSNSGSPGDVVSFTFDLINAGNQTASQSYNITTYISADNQLSSDDLQEGNIGTGNTQPGTTPNVNGAITIPSNFPPGSYWLIIKVDDDNNVQETNENNNVFAIPLPIVDDSGGCIAPVNVANEKPATQSSTLNFGGIDSGAANAVDGNIDGNYYNGSVAVTTESNQAWWQVDLGGLFNVFSVEIYNRTEGTARLNDFYVMTSATPFTSSSLTTARNTANNETYIPGQASVPSLWFTNSNVPVRYVRVQRAGSGYLTLAELRVNGCPINNLNDNGTQSFEAQNEVTTSFSLIKLFPNPTSGELFGQIESTTDKEISIQIVNILGQVKLERKMRVEIGANTFQLQLDHFENGMYNVIFQDGDKLVSKQFVISK